MFLAMILGFIVIEIAVTMYFIRRETNDRK